jgi:hypothetical protein
MCSLYLTQYAIMFIELCFNFMSVFLYNYPSCGQLLFCLSYAILSHAGLLEVPVTYLGSLGYFSCSVSSVAEWLLLEKVNAKWGV